MDETSARQQELGALSEDRAAVASRTNGESVTTARTAAWV